RRDELSVDELAAVGEAFRLFDAAGAGSIDYLEFKCCLRALGFALSKEQLAATVKEFDRESAGRVSRRAYLEICARLYTDQPAEERLAETFALFDESGSGFITRRDLKRICREVGQPLSDDECQAMIDEFDTDADGRINLADFRAVLSEATM
ncbi:hypothetical protein T492DRAFT_574214, partial [Pavlovales sp. CCMP2436]